MRFLQIHKRPLVMPPSNGADPMEAARNVVNHDTEHHRSNLTTSRVSICKSIESLDAKLRQLDSEKYRLSSVREDKLLALESIDAGLSVLENAEAQTTERLQQIESSVMDDIADMIEEKNNG